MSKADPEKEFALENKLIEETLAISPTAKSSASLESSVETRNPEAATRLGDDPVKEEGAGTDSKQTGDPREQLGQLKAELDKYKDIALRSVADLDNYRKRMAREKDDAIRYANASFLERLIPILDNFELGLQAAKAGGSQSAVYDGMTMVFKQLQEFLASCGVETIDATGEHFDPNLHEAIAQEENSEVEDGVVIRQLRKGYRLKDRLIRPANVVVSKGAHPGEDSEDSETAGAST
jgi:molecular chaperone GrpE